MRRMFAHVVWSPASRAFRVGIVLVALVSSMVVPRAAASEVVPTCDEAAGLLQIVGFQLIVNARSGDANDLTIALVGGSYTPPLTGVPLTTQVYRISDPGAAFAYVPETLCASDEAATCSQDDDGVTTCSAILTDITVFLGDGNDTASLVGVPAPALIAGGNGNDSITGGDNGDNLLGGDAGDFIAGGGGDDNINGGTGWDTLEGGPGDDTIRGGGNDPFSTSGNDTIRGGPGHDTLDGGSGSLTDPDYDLLDYSAESTPIVVNLTTGEGTDTVRGFEEVLGGAGDDDITGHRSASRIDGGPGNDTIDGQGAIEVLGGAGDDVMYARMSEDETLQGGPGNDRLFDNFRCDCFIGDHNDDVLSGGPGDDRLVAGTGNNTLLGGDGDDWLVAGCEKDGEHSTLVGGDGHDTLSEIPESVLDDECFFGDRHEGTIEHGDANDVLNGGANVDTIDLCVPEDPNSLDVPAGYRPDAETSLTTCLRTADQYVTPSGAGHSAYRGHVAELDQLISIENAIGGGGNDLMFGMGGYVNGGPGTDDISCGRGLDAGPGGAGDQGDVLRDCPGASYRGVADYSRRADGVRVTLDGQPNDGTWNGSASSEGDNVLATGGIAGGSAGDVLTGDGADNVLTGGAGDDQIDAGGGQDIVFAGDGADTVDGGPGGDLLDAGAGNDTVLARDGVAELIDCGPDTDVARLDRLDQPTDCESTIVGLTETVAAGDVVTTDVEGNGADTTHPVEVTIKAAAAGTAEATEYPNTGQNPSGFVLLGVRYDIRLPAGTAESPNVLTFRVDASAVPAGQGPGAIFVFKNRILVPDCDPSPPRVATTAAPDPCVASRTVLADGDVEIVVLTSTASDWEFAVDVEAPTITVASPAEGTSLLLHATAIADYACVDGGSGLASCIGTVPDDKPFDTDTIGPKSFTVSATDRVGNAATKTVTYRVIYDFNGFFSPLENPGHVDGLLNVVKAGAAVPVKFSLHGNQGLGVLATGSPTSTSMTCDSHAATDALEETSGSGASGLAYDAATDTYRLAWKTDKSWAGSCRRFNLRLADGTDHEVLFKFTK